MKMYEIEITREGEEITIRQPGLGAEEDQVVVISVQQASAVALELNEMAVDHYLEERA